MSVSIVARRPLALLAVLLTGVAAMVVLPATRGLSAPTVLTLDGPTWIIKDRPFRIVAKAANDEEDATEDTRLIAAITRPGCQVLEGDSLAEGGYTYNRNGILETRISMECHRSQRMGLGVVAVSPKSGPLAESFYIATVVDASFRVLTAAATLIVGVTGFGIWAVARRRPIGMRSATFLTVTACVLIAVARTLVERPPLHDADGFALLGMSVLPAAFALTLASGLRHPITSLGFVPLSFAIGMNSIAAGAALLVLGSALVAGTTTAASTWLETRSHARRTMLATGPFFIMASFIAVAVLGMRTEIFELVAWLRYGDSMRVPPFQQ